MEKFLYVMIGAPGSGKSTFISNHLKDGSVWVSRDAIRYSMVSEDEDYFSKESEVLAQFIKSINEMLSPKQPYKYIFADATHLNEKSRKKLLNNLKNKPTKIIGLYFDIPLEIIQKRNAQRTGRERVPAQIVAKMYKSMTIPSKKEGFDGVFIINENNKVKGVIK